MVAILPRQPLTCTHVLIRPWERTHPARSPAALGARASGALITYTGPRLRAPSGAAGSRPQRWRGRVGAGRYALGARASRSLTGSAESTRRRRAHHLHHPSTASAIRRRRFPPPAVAGWGGAGRTAPLSTAHRSYAEPALRHYAVPLNGPPVTLPPKRYTSSRKSNLTARQCWATGVMLHPGSTCATIAHGRYHTDHHSVRSYAWLN